MLLRVNNVSRHFFKKIYVIKAVKVVLEQFKLAKYSCNIQEQLFPADIDVCQIYLGPLWYHLSYVFNYNP